MKKLSVALLLAFAGLMARPAHAQAPRLSSEEQVRQANEQGVRKTKRKATSADVANMQRRMNMNPDEAKRDQQIEVLEARAGGGANTSFGRSAGPARQYEKGTGGFTVRKFKAGKHTRNVMKKRGQSRPAPGIDPKGKPLKHKPAKRFLFF